MSSVAREEPRIVSVSRYTGLSIGVSCQSSMQFDGILSPSYHMAAIYPEFFEEPYDITIEFRLNAPFRREQHDGDFVHEILGEILATFNEGEWTEPVAPCPPHLVQLVRKSQIVGDAGENELPTYRQ